MKALFESADLARRLQGLALDALGLGPQTTPSRRVRSTRRFELVAYPATGAGPAVLVVPAPIKRAYIWDLAPGSSAVGQLISSGLQVYLVDWARPQPGDEAIGLAEYADRALGECAEAVRRETGQSKLYLAGHSLGGTLAAVFASLHRAQVRGLLLLEAPIEFGAGRLEAAVRSAPPAGFLTAALGNVPGTFIDFASVCADPIAFDLEPRVDATASGLSPAASRLHWRVRRWTLDESPMARRLFEEVAEKLYRENRFARGALRVGGRLADPRNITAPILAVLDRRSRIVPPESIEACRTRTGSRDVTVLEYAGDAGVALQHVGVLVGAHAHARLWPRIGEWMRERL